MDKSVSALCGCDRSATKNAPSNKKIKGKDDLRTETFDRNKGFQS